jgi:ferritin-like metal-binding protein YciE
MKSTATSKSAATKKNGTAKKSNTDSLVSHDQLNELFIGGLKDIYWAEKALTKALPKMIKNATSEELIEALTSHLGETEGQVTRLEEVFSSIDEKAVAKKCEAMAGLIKEAEEIMEECEDGGMRDAGIISAGQKVEHYEIATYGTLRAFAEILGHEKAAGLLQETLDEEKAADEKLTEVTPSVIMLMVEQE